MLSYRTIFCRTFLTLSVIFVVLIILIGVGAALLCTEKVQQWLLKETTTSLSERLNTRVDADSISINPFAGRVSLYGFSIDDLNKTEMLHVDTFQADIAMFPLLERHIEVNSIRLYSTNAILYKEQKDSAANFQFIIDAFNKEHPKKKNTGGNEKKFKLSFDIDDLLLQNINLKWDVRDQKPKNYHNHGAFDVNHINATLTMNANLHQVEKDSMRTEIIKMCLHDKVSGLDIRSLTAQCAFSKKHLTVKNLQIKLPNTTITPGTVSMGFTKEKKSDGKEKTLITFEPFNFKANVVLKDIAKPFAPSLDRFTTPLTLSMKVGGCVPRITFSKLLITTPDKRLHLTAHGDICNIDEDKTKIALHFTNINLKAKDGIKEEIVKHFAHKMRMKMQRQMKIIGNIHFRGYLTIRYRSEEIGGTLMTKFGNVTTNFVLNSDTKLMTGNISADNFEFGKLMNVPPLYPISFKGDFVFDVSTTKHRINKHGRLPIGHLVAEIPKAKYGILSAKDIHAEVTSDGAVAEGFVLVPMKILSITTNFTYTQTDTEQALKVHPKLSLGKKKLSPEKQNSHPEKKEVSAEKKKKKNTSFFKNALRDS